MTIGIIYIFFPSFSSPSNSIILCFFREENLALGKPADQSSLFGLGLLEGVAGKAVDGVADPNYDNGYCSHTQSDNPSWWRVDLGSNGVPVSEVYIVNRFTTDPNLQLRSKDYRITLGKSFQLQWIFLLTNDQHTFYQLPSISRK